MEDTFVPPIFGNFDLTELFDDPGYTTGGLLNLTQTSNLESSKSPKIHTLSVQMNRVPGMKSSIDSLALLDYDDSELSELDPMIVSCLRSPNLSDTDDETTTSEV